MPAKKNEVAVAPAIDQLPEMYGEAMDLGGGDITFPKIYLLSGLSTMVKEGIAKAGDVVRVLSHDDPNPTFLIGGPEGHTHYDAYVFGRTEVVAVYSDDGTEYMPPGTPLDRANPNMWRGYRYLLAIPSVDPSMPARQQFIKTAGRATFQNLNYFLERARAEKSGIPHVRFTLGERTSQNGRHTYHILRAEEITRGDDYELALKQAEFARQATEVDAAPVVDGNAPSF